MRNKSSGRHTMKSLYLVVVLTAIDKPSLTLIGKVTDMAAALTETAKLVSSRWNTIRNVQFYILNRDSVADVLVNTSMSDEAVHFAIDDVLRERARDFGKSLKRSVFETINVDTTG